MTTNAHKVIRKSEGQVRSHDFTNYSELGCMDQRTIGRKPLVLILIDFRVLCINVSGSGRGSDPLCRDEIFETDQIH